MAFNIKYVYDLVDNISPRLKNVKSNIKQAETAVRRSAAKMGSSFDNMKHKLDGVGKKARDVGKSLFLKLTVPVGLLGGKFINAASDAEETANRFAEVFKGIGDDSEDAVARLSAAFKLSSDTTKTLLADTGDLLTGIGLEKKAALELSESVVALSTDLASFKNVQGGAERVSLAITKALLGEREMLKDAIKVALREEDVKKRAVKIAQMQPGLTEQQSKAMATLQLITERSKAAIGDFNRTQDQFANRTRIVSEQFKELSIQFGQIMIPIATKVLNIISKIIEKLDSLSPTTKKVILFMAGLAAVLSPVLIAFGLVASGIAALGGPLLFIIGLFKSLALLAAANPFIAFATAAALIITNWQKVVDIFQSVFDWIGKIANSGLNKLMEGIGSLANKFGFGAADVNQNLNTNINQRQDVTVGGQLGININGLPKGSSANFTPAPGNQMNVGMNTLFAGAR